MHVRFGWCGLILPCLDAAARGATAMERFGETERWSRENRKEGAEEPQRLTRVGEEERFKKVVEGEEKLEVEDAKPEGEEEEEEERK